IYIHESFKRKDFDVKNITCKYTSKEIVSMDKATVLNDLTFADLPIKNLEGLTFQEYKDKFIGCRSFTGIDLVILKTRKPLPADLTYPQFVGDDITVENTNGISIGFGTMVYNKHPEAPQPVSDDILKKNQRHVISCKVSSSSLEENNKILLGEY